MPPASKSKGVGLRALSLSAVIGFSLSSADAIFCCFSSNESVTSTLGKNREKIGKVTKESPRAGLYFEFGIPPDAIDHAMKEREGIQYLLHKGDSSPAAGLMEGIEDVPMGHSPSTASGLYLALSEYSQMLDLDELIVLSPKEKEQKVQEILLMIENSHPELLRDIDIRLEFLEGNEDERGFYRSAYHSLSSQAISILDALGLEEVVLNLGSPGEAAPSDYLKTTIPKGLGNTAIIMLFLLLHPFAGRRAET